MFVALANDSLSAEFDSLHICCIEQQYESRVHELELQNTLRRAHFYLVISLCAVIIMLLIIFLVSYRNRSVQRNRDLEVSRMRETLVAEKMRNLRARITPHYLINVLRQLSADSEGTLINEKIDLLTKTLRSSLELSDQAVVCLKREVDFVKDYLELRPQTPAFRVEWQIDAEVDLWQTMVPGMIIQLPVENVLKYAYDAGGTISIRIERGKRGGMDGIEIVVEDFGRGFRQSSNIPSQGIGLHILTRTISFINMYNNNDPLDMTVTDKAQRGEGQGVRVEFFIPKLWKSPFQS